MRVAVAILAAGKGERFGGDKVLENLGGKPVWRWSFDSYRLHPRVDLVGLVGSEKNLPALDTADAAFKIPGGENRQESSRLGVEACDADIVLIHDAARPFVSEGVVSEVIDAIVEFGAAAAAIPVSDTLRERDGAGYRIVDRGNTVAMQTPQGARRDLLLRAHASTQVQVTDDIALLEAIGQPYRIVEGDPRAFKITTTYDLTRARAMVSRVETRTGFGYDIHPFATDDRPLMLGGVHFPGARGLHGHSDADVVLHAAVDALLGAAALGDIGQHFPNSDPRWRGEPSSTFLAYAAKLLREGGWQIVNLDLSVIAEEPKVMPLAAEIRSRIGELLGIDPGRIGFKATTNERLGALGRGEGIAAYAVATIRTEGD